MEDNTSFEDKMKKLEEIALELEKGELNLDDSVSKFEEGMKLSKECSQMLEKAEKKITMLIKDEDGNISEDKFVQNED
jgi:exodeoxyribonuclease VII small subunit